MMFIISCDFLSAVWLFEFLQNWTELNCARFQEFFLFFFGNIFRVREPLNCSSLFCEKKSEPKRTNGFHERNQQFVHAIVPEL